jgi:hypothetical protein
VELEDLSAALSGMVMVSAHSQKMNYPNANVE